MSKSIESRMRLHQFPPYNHFTSQSSPNYQPLSPTSIERSTTKRKQWVQSTTKRFGIDKLKTKMPGKSSNSQDGSPAAFPSPLPSINRTRIPVRRSSGTPLDQKHVDSTIQQGLIQSPQLSPTNKPLPSLPFATIANRSPVHRRSLIDATEVPLRRSFSPQPGHVELEDWPSLAPNQPEQKQMISQNGNTIKPSVGESVIEGMRQLNLEDHDNNYPSEISRVSTAKKSHDSVETKTTTSCDNTEHQPGYTLSDAGEAFGAVVSPAASSTYSELQNSVSHHSSGYSTSKSACNSQLNGQGYHHPPSSPRNSMDNNHGVSSPLNASNKTILTISSQQCSQSKVPGPVRSKSKSRYGVSARGSPYMVVSRPHGLSNVPMSDHSFRKPVLVSVPARPLLTSEKRASLLEASQVVAVKHSRASIQNSRRSSIPLPSRLMRHLPNEDSEADVPQTKRIRSNSRVSEQDPDDGDIDSDAKEMIPKSRRGPVEKSNDACIANNDHTVDNTSENNNSSDLVMTSPSQNSDLEHSHHTPQDVSQKEPDIKGLYVKKIRNNHPDGPILRVSDSAQRVLFGDGNDSEKDDMHGPKRNSLIDSRQSMVLKQQLRRSSSYIMSHLQIGRGSNKETILRHPENEVATHDNENKDTVDHLAKSDLNDVKENNDQVPKDAKLSVQLSTEAIGGINADESDIRYPASVQPSDWPLRTSQTPSTLDQLPRLRSQEADDSKISPLQITTEDDDCICEVDETSPEVYSETGPVTRLATPLLSADQTPHLARKSSRSDLHQYFRDARTAKVEGDINATRSDSRAFPPRTSSRQQVPQIHLQPESLTNQRSLTSIPRKTYGEHLGQLSEPKHMKTFSDSLRKINSEFDAMQPYDPDQHPSPPATSSKKMISNIRSLFHKRSSENNNVKHSKVGNATPGSNEKSSPLLATPAPYKNSRKYGLSPLGADIMTSRVPKPSVASRAPPPSSNKITPLSSESTVSAGSEIKEATRVALRLLEMAQQEQPGPRQNMFVELGKITIQIVNSARDTEKASEQAKQAAARAEIQCLESKKAVADVTDMIEKVLSEEKNVI